MDSSTKDNSELRRVPKGFNETRKVRVVAKIKSLATQELDGGSTASWISVNKPDGESSESVTLSFGDQPASRKETYEVDYCYEQNEDIENIFAREVKSLIPGVFDGHHATVIAYGARSTGKTSTIQGTIEKPGLASLSINELLLMAKEKEKSIFISYYEVYVDHVYDLLDPNRPTVLVLDNGQGKIQLKGLSRIPVKSLSDFYELYFVGSSSRKQGQKIANEPPYRSHKGLIVHISSSNETASDTRCVAKMNFVDMAGYEDAKRKSTDGNSHVENSKINKSIYALLNVASALNSNGNHVPYRESKLTRILQDSLGRAQSRILMITCLNSSFCQDSIYMANLAARSCQVTKRVASDAIKKIKSSTNFVVHSSFRNEVPKTVSATVKKLRNQVPKTVSAAVKKQTISRSTFTERKTSVSKASSVMQGRRLFDDTRKHMGKLDKEIQLPSSSSRLVPLKHEEPSSVVDQDQVNPLSCFLKSEEEDSTSPLQKELSAVEISSAIEEDSTSALEKELSAVEISSAVETSVVVSENVLNNNQDLERIDDGVDAAFSATKDGSDLDKENTSYRINQEKSPPISARLRELSNNLRLICSSTPVCLNFTDGEAPYGIVSNDVMEPRTPTMERSLRVYDEHDVAIPTTPWETFSVRNTGVKNSLVEDYLRFLNTADKEDLKRLKGIGEKRAKSIIELRAESPEPFKSLDDLMDIGLSAKQVKELMKKGVGELFFN